MGLTLVTRFDSGFPTGWPVSLIGVAVGLTVAAPAGVLSATSSGGLGSAALGTAPLGA